MFPTVLVTYFLVALALSFVCSLLEATLLSTTNSHIELLLKEGKPSGRILHGFKERINRPLIAILTTNTVANMFGAAGVGAEASKLARAAGLDETLWLGIASFALTFAILIGAEIIPKSIGATYWKIIASPASYVLRVLVTLMMPAVLVLEFIPRLLTRHAHVGSVTRDEIAVLAELGRRYGTIPMRETQIIANLFALEDLRASDVMTPRVEVLSLPASESVGDAATRHGPLRYSRIPLYGENPDEIIGLVLRYRIFELCARGKTSETLRSIMRPVHFVPESQTIARLLDEFIKRSAHLFVVVNEYGGPEGIVTLEDVIETLLGVEIVDETDTVADLRKAALEKLAKRKRAAVELDES